MGSFCWFGSLSKPRRAVSPGRVPGRPHGGPASPWPLQPARRQGPLGLAYEGDPAWTFPRPHRALTLARWEQACGRPGRERPRARYPSARAPDRHGDLCFSPEADNPMALFSSHSHSHCPHSRACHSGVPGRPRGLSQWASGHCTSANRPLLAVMRVRRLGGKSPWNVCVLRDKLFHIQAR